MIDIASAPAMPTWMDGLRDAPCLLCSRPSAVVGLYVPGKDSPASHPAGGTRLIAYSLCRRCAERLDILIEVIETKLEAELREAGVNSRGSIQASQDGGIGT